MTRIGTLFPKTKVLMIYAVILEINYKYHLKCSILALLFIFFFLATLKLNVVFILKARIAKTTMYE